MKKFVVVLLIQFVFTATLIAQPNKSATILSGRSTHSVAATQKVNVIKSLKNKNMNASQILHEIMPDYSEQQINQLTQYVTNLYEVGFKTDEIAIALKNQYSLTLALCTKVIYQGYWGTPLSRGGGLWPYQFQDIISTAYNSNDKFTIRLLKEAGLFMAADIDVFFNSYFYHYGDPVRYLDYIKAYYDAGFLPWQIYNMIITTPKYGHIHRVNYCKVMKNVGVSAHNVAKTLKSSAYDNTRIIDFLKQAGYTAGEILTAMQSLK